MLCSRIISTAPQLLPRYMLMTFDIQIILMAQDGTEQLFQKELKRIASI